VRLDEELLGRGLVREVINRIQKLRKKAGLVVEDDIEVFIEFPPSSAVAKAVAAFGDTMGAIVQKPIAPMSKLPPDSWVITSADDEV
jgi:isoleucyl-tRNA synthetase